MLIVVITATGDQYQRAGSLAAVTYRLRNPTSRVRVSVALPESERPTTVLRCLASRFRFDYVQFPFVPISARQITTQVKTQAFLYFAETAATDNVLIYADADTFCLKPILLSSYIRNERPRNFLFCKFIER